MAGADSKQDEAYLAAAAEFGPALGRLARAYEADTDERRDLVQDIHVGLWRSFAAYDGRCSLRTWVYRVAHNVATSHVMKRKRKGKTVSLETLEETANGENIEAAASEKQTLDKLTLLIRTLDQPDRQIILLYLEDMDAAAIAEVTGIKPGTVATKIHRIKALLARRFREGTAP